MSKASKRRAREARKKAEQKLLANRGVMPPKDPPKSLASISAKAKPRWYRAKWFRTVRWVTPVVVGIFTLISILPRFLSYKPKVSITVSSGVNAKDPFASAFVLKNESPFNLRKVSFAYHLNNLEGFKTFPHDILKPQRTRLTDFGARSADDIQPLPNLQSGESTSLIFPQRFLDSYTFCDIKISVSYHTWWWRREFTDTFRFATRQERALVWYPKALSEPIYRSPERDFLEIEPFPGDKVTFTRQDPPPKK